MCSPPPKAKPLNALTIDVEDWIQSVYDVEAPLTDLFVHNTLSVLALLARHNVRATFFVLGLAAEKAPSLVKEIHAAGHEVQSHGYGHRLIHTQTPEAFHQDVLRSKQMLEDLIGGPVIGYRAPAFSITRKTLWALDELAAAGFRFDSSIFPVRLRRYGISGLPATPYRLRTPRGHDFIEVPVCSYRVGPCRLPAGGGGYLRTAPLWYMRRAIESQNRAKQPAVLYMHPYELAPHEFYELPVSIPWRTRFQQGWGRSSVAQKITDLLTHHRFGPVREMLKANPLGVQCPVIDLASSGRPALPATETAPMPA